jgi:adenylate cyclase
LGDPKPVLLSVDDDQSILALIEKTLSKLDIEVLTASSGKEGLAVLKARAVDVVITDMRMPEMSGSEFLKQVTALQPHACRIMLTEGAQFEDAKAAINEGGVSRYLDIPWNDDELRRAVDDALKMAALARENDALYELTQAQNVELLELNNELEERVAARTQELQHVNGMLNNTLAELEETHELMVDLVANIAALPNPESEKARRKLRLALAIGAELGLDEEDLLHLKYATRLHKLGWVGLPKSVTAKPLSSLSDQERSAFEKHPAYAQAVLFSVPHLRKASEIVASQHEDFNGHGFPEKRTAEGIPLGARILAVARDYYELMAGVIDKTRLTPAEAVARIVAESDDAYDGEVVKAFQAVVRTVDELDPSLDETSVRTVSLLPAMRLARDLITDEGVVLLAKGTTLTEGTIASLINLEMRSDKKLQIFVMKDAPSEKEIAS